MKLTVLLTLLGFTWVTADKLRVCYYSNWSQYRNGNGKFWPTDIPADLCTHLIYSFAKVDTNLELAMYEWNDDKLYTQFNDLKTKNPGLKTLLAVGGWNAGSTLFSNMAHSATDRQNFAKQTTQFLRKWNFDGFDLDWEYPTQRDGSRPTDRERFIDLIDDLLNEFESDASSSGKPRLLLTAAVAAGKSTVDPAYDIPAMAEKLDFINLMSYDLHGAWESETGHNSPLYARSGEDVEKARLNVDWAAKYWVSKGVPKNKLIIGLATYGRSFTLKSSSQTHMGAEASGAGPAGTFTRENGFMAYYEICTMLDSGAGTRHWHAEHKVPYMVSGTTWVGYDDTESITIKLQYIRDEGYGGAMVWNIDLDDFKQTCTSSSRPYPIMRLMEEVLGGYDPPTQPTQAPTTAGPTDKPMTTTMSTGGPFSCDGRANGFYPDPEDCARHYECWSGVMYTGECQNGQLWNQQVKGCDNPSNVDCETEKTTKAPTTKAPTTQAPTTQAPTTEAPTTKAPTTEAPTTETPTTQAPTTETPTTQAPTNPPTTAGSDDDFCVDKTDGLQKDDADCRFYYNCGHGQTYRYQCPAGTLFSPSLRICDWERNVDCDEKPKPRLADFCKNKASGLHSFPEDCSKYYSCDNGRTHVMKCFEGTYWSPDIYNCDWKDNVDCGDRMEPVETRSLGNICYGLANGYYPDISNCHSYIHCTFGQINLKTCGPYFMFNPNTRACDWPERVRCFYSKPVQI